MIIKNYIFHYLAFMNNQLTLTYSVICNSPERNPLNSDFKHWQSTHQKRAYGLHIRYTKLKVKKLHVSWIISQTLANDRY